MDTCTFDHKAVRLLTDHPDRFARQGAVVATWRTHAPRRLKRQARLRTALFREKVIRPLNQYIEQMFALFGNDLYPKRGKPPTQPSQTCAHHAHKSQTKTLRGSEIRGIRQAGPRLSAADVPPHLIPDFPFPLPAPLAELALPKAELSPPVDQNNPHCSQPKPEFSPSVDQNNPYQSPFKPNVGHVRNPAFTELRPHNAHKPRTMSPTTRVRFPKEITGSCHRRSRSPPPAPRQPASAHSPMERGPLVLRSQNRRNPMRHRTLATPWLMHLSIDVCTTNPTDPQPFHHRL